MSTVISPIVTFGNPQPGGTICVGKGVCKVSSTQDTNDNTPTNATVNPTSDFMKVSNPQGIPVRFELSPLDRSVLIMSFRLSDLEKNQPEQVPFFKSGGYEFDDHYNFHHPEFEPLAFHHSPRIEKGKKNQVQITGDLVTTFFHYSHK